MARIKFFVRYSDYANACDLTYTTDGSTPEGYEQITRREAESLARRESRRRKDDPSFSGYASEYIYPAGMDDDPEQVSYWARYNISGWYLSGRVVLHDAPRGITYRGKHYDDIRDAVAASMTTEPMSDEEAHAEVTLDMETGDI